MFNFPAIKKIIRRRPISQPPQQVVQGMDFGEYSSLRKSQWESQAKKSYGPVRGAAVVANDRGWREWEEYKLVDYIIRPEARAGAVDKIVLEFGCGVGRVMKAIAPLVKRVDGVDIAPVVLEGAVELLGGNKAVIVDPVTLQQYPDVTTSQLYLTSGYDLAGVPDEFYDLVYSVVCLIHVLHPGVRQSLYKEFYRVLKPGGTCQLQFFKSSSDDFGRADVTVVNRGAFAFRDAAELQAEFESTEFHMQRIQESDPIPLDREGGVEKYFFVDLLKKK